MNTRKKTTRNIYRRGAPSDSQSEGKITKSGATPEIVEQRARELAAIEGREPNKATDSDRQDAERELRGPIHPTSAGKDDPEIIAEPWDLPAGSTGRRTKKMLPTDDQITKELVEEGVDEAEHDQMVEARKDRK